MSFFPNFFFHSFLQTYKSFQIISSQGQEWCRTTWCCRHTLTHTLKEGSIVKVYTGAITMSSLLRLRVNQWSRQILHLKTILRGKDQSVFIGLKELGRLQRKKEEMSAAKKKQVQHTEFRFTPEAEQRWKQLPSVGRVNGENTDLQQQFKCWVFFLCRMWTWQK